MKLQILAFGAHPDDTELSCSGTLRSLVVNGYRTGVVDLTRGEMGTRGTPEGRLEEAKKSAEILGLAVRENLGLPDTELDNTPENRIPIIRAIRYYKPDICLVTAPDDRHPDHRNASRLLIDAMFYSGLRKIETIGPDDKKQEPWRPYHILHYMQNYSFNPSFIYDISDTIEIKEKAILAFESQFMAKSGVKTYISSKEFFESLRGRARYYGHLIGVEFGEPFLYHGGPVPLKDMEVFLKTKPFR